MELCNKSHESSPRPMRDTPSLPLRRPWNPPQPGISEDFIHVCVSMSLQQIKSKQQISKKQTKIQFLPFFLKVKKSFKLWQDILCKVSKIEQVAHNHNIPRQPTSSILCIICLFSMNILQLCWFTKRPPHTRARKDCRKRQTAPDW